MIRDYETVNHVPAKGGSMAAAGPTVAGGMVFVGSGYVFSSRHARQRAPGLFRAVGRPELHPNADKRIARGGVAPTFTMTI